MEGNLNELFWNSTIEEIKRGYTESEETLQCIICGEIFIKGKIYNIQDELYDAKKAVGLHIRSSHESMLKYLLEMNRDFTGLTGSQQELLLLFSRGISDKDISSKLKIAQSTIRNHRYKLREKEKQARLFLSMMELLSENTDKEINILDRDVICDAHKTATTLDDRYNITEAEKLSTIKAHITEYGALKNYPSKEKKKIIVLDHIMKNFKRDTMYSEKEINRILKRIYEDYATLRRSLIEYGFMDRSDDCKNYWVKE